MAKPGVRGARAALVALIAVLGAYLFTSLQAIEDQRTVQATELAVGIALLGLVYIAYYNPSLLDAHDEEQIAMSAVLVAVIQLASGAITLATLEHQLFPTRDLAIAFLLIAGVAEELIFTGAVFFTVRDELLRDQPPARATFLAALVAGYVFSVFHSWAYLGLPLSEGFTAFFRDYPVFASTFVTEFAKCLIAQKDRSLVGPWFGHVLGNLIISGGIV